LDFPYISTYYLATGEVHIFGEKSEEISLYNIIGGCYTIGWSVSITFLILTGAYIFSWEYVSQPSPPPPPFLVAMFSLLTNFPVLDLFLDFLRRNCLDFSSKFTVNNVSSQRVYGGQLENNEA